jgi:nucleotide-binding universal stress UspA family protein
MSTAPQIVATPTRIKSILFPTDFSEVSARALPHALALGCQHQAVVHVAHVITPTTRYVDLSGELTEDKPEIDIREEAWNSLRTFLPPELTKDVDCDTTIREGPLWDCVSRLIEEHNIDLVIVGTKATGGVTKMVLGSGAEEIFRESRCPVLTIGPHVSPNAKGRFEKILFALDFTDQCMRAYPYALEFTTESHGSLTVLHVVLPAPVVFGSCGMDEYTDMMRLLAIKEVRKATDYARHPVRPSVKVVCGDPAKVIVEQARLLPADLIVMGVLHRGRFARHFPWTTTHEVVRHAPCPVLTVRS